MSDITPEPEMTDLGLIPSSEAKPEAVGTLSVRYVDGAPVLVVTAGTVMPATITVVDAAGIPVAAYTAGPPPAVAQIIITPRAPDPGYF
ncbi:hypothetical protein [Streptomyces sp. RKAG337]|uniref:hypothetical protein n=1 Tax=Streptomyces sp. RKAG337 TaxID=2893404 RepID=UPI002033ED5A|nr:hypothetical protein [Streptomyces sp. RKAG337]MCM2425095.1 hypothetical protein [Streptomyces sp. RKAG337]